MAETLAVLAATRMDKFSDRELDTGRDTSVHLGSHVATQHSALFVIAGPCVIESEGLVLETAAALRELSQELQVPLVFKASFDKANRTSSSSFRGLGIDAGLAVLARVRSELGMLTLTDVHEDTPVDEVASVVDVLQTPAFLCRQTNFLQRVARAGKPVNVKKGQFLSPLEAEQVVQKLRDAGGTQLLLCERGVTFGYNNLVVDMRGLAQMRATGCPVVFDATHSVQRPGGLGSCSGGDRRMVPVLARAAVAAGVSGVFLETHPDPDAALSDGPNSWPLGRMRELLESLLEIDRVVKQDQFLEETIS